MKKNENYYDWIIEFVDDYINSNGEGPTVSEVAEELSVSLATASRYLRYMSERNMLVYNGYRRIETIRSLKKKLNSALVPVLGRVSCGLPKFAEENIETYVELPTEIFGSGDFFLLYANGESMINAGIENGDLVLIRQQSNAEPGQIVVALVDDETTLKRYYPEPEYNRYRLHPENDYMDDIYVESCSIQGVVAKVIKNVE